jgi:putative two-component system response regulator
MKQHTVIGAKTLKGALDLCENAVFLSMAYDIALTHHERFDGTGYPQGLRGHDIPLSGRIVALVDVYDALTTKRVYKPAFSHDEACRIIIEGSGNHFDPEIVRVFIDCKDEFDAIRAKLADEVLVC